MTQTRSIDFESHAVQERNGSFSVCCRLSGMTDQEAARVSAWLQHIVCCHVGEIVQENSSPLTKH